MTTMDLHVSPLGQVEGDLDVRVTITDGVVTDAWTEAAMFRGFEIILRGKDPQAGLIMTPRICGICGGSHLYKACYAVDTAWGTYVPPNATIVRNLGQITETLQSMPRYFYAIMGPDLTAAQYAGASTYEEAARRFAPYVGTSYQTGVTLSQLPVEIYAIFGGQWPHSSFMIPGGVMCAPTLSDITRSTAILDHWGREWLEGQWLGCSVDRYLEIKTWEDFLAWMDENESQHNSDLAFFYRHSMEIGLDKYGQGYGNFLATGTFLSPELYTNPTVEGRNAALQSRSGIYANGQYFDFDQARVSEDITHSFFKGTGSLHPWEGVTDPIDPADGPAQGKYTWAKAPRYDVPGMGYVPLEVGPLARQMMANRPDAASHQDYDPFVADMIAKVGPNVLTRVLARMHEAPKYFRNAQKWLTEIDLHADFYTKPTEPLSGKGFGSTEAARGALSDWIVIEDGKIANYQVITPTAWNIGPRDGSDNVGPMEKSFIGAPVENPDFPVELAQVAHSFDSCLVCTVHAYDGKTGRELAKFRMGGG
ncbi:MAG: nickel-dependent hydrogenase large subunit [Actinobacteria bacterium]|nr:nickel-dependent hydrogenase large subunit [Actinomycetota bacterium]